MVKRPRSANQYFFYFFGSTWSWWCSPVIGQSSQLPFVPTYCLFVGLTVACRYWQWVSRLSHTTFFSWETHSFEAGAHCHVSALHRPDQNVLDFSVLETLSMADLRTVCRTAIGLINCKGTLNMTKTDWQHLPKARHVWLPSELEALTNTGLRSIMEPLCSRGVQDHVSCMTMYSAAWSWHECVAFVKSAWDSAYNCRCCGRPSQLLGSEAQSTMEVVDAQYMSGSIVPVMCSLACVLLTESSHLGTFCSVATCCSGDFSVYRCTVTTGWRGVVQCHLPPWKLGSPRSLATLGVWV